MKTNINKWTNLLEMNVILVGVSENASLPSRENLMQNVNFITVSSQKDFATEGGFVKVNAKFDLSFCESQMTVFHTIDEDFFVFFVSSGKPPSKCLSGGLELHLKSSV